MPMGIRSGLHCSIEISLGMTRDGASSHRPNLSHWLCKVKWCGHHISSGSAPVQLPRVNDLCSWHYCFSMEVHRHPMTEFYMLIFGILCWRTPGWYFVLAPKHMDLQFRVNFIPFYYFCFQGNLGFFGWYFHSSASNFMTSAVFSSPLQCFMPKFLMKIVD